MEFISLGERLYKAISRFQDRQALPGMTYGQFGQAIQQARQRIRQQARPGQCIALQSQKSPATYAMWLACWMDGFPTIFLSPSWGEIANQKILQTLRPAMTFSDGPPLMGEQPLQPATPVSASQTLYYIGTSGSTGEPKLIDVSQESLVAWIENSQSHWDVRPTDRVSQVFDLTFDPSISDILWTFLSGACLVPLDLMGQLNTLDWIRDQQITIWSSSPSQAQSLCLARSDQTTKLTSLRRSTFIGEILTKKFVHAWAGIAPQSTIENHYGPAECVISVSQEVIDPSAPLDALMSVGQPFPGVQFEIDHDGILTITSNQVATGYVGLQSPLFGKRNGVRSYRTGDCAFVTAQGHWTMTGRADYQIKIQGQRWESEGIEACLEASLKIPLCVLKYSENAREGLDLILLQSPPRDFERRLDEIFTGPLPASLRPRQIWLRDSPPLTTSGKIDRPLLRTEMLKGKLKKHEP